MMTPEQRKEWLRKLKEGDKVCSRAGGCGDWIVHTVLHAPEGRGNIITTGFYKGQELTFDNETGSLRALRVGFHRVTLYPLTDEVIATNCVAKIMSLLDVNRQQLKEIPLEILGHLLAEVQNAVGHLPPTKGNQ